MILKAGPFIINENAFFMIFFGCMESVLCLKLAVAIYTSAEYGMLIRLHHK